MDGLNWVSQEPVFHVRYRIFAGVRGHKSGMKQDCSLFVRGMRFPNKKLKNVILLLKNIFKATGLGLKADGAFINIEGGNST